MRTMDLIVVNVGPIQKSNINEFKYHYIILKSTDDSDKTKYVLNLQKRDNTVKGAQNYKNWLDNLVPGAVLNTVMQERNKNNVDQWKEFKVLKRAHEAPRKKDNGNPITKVDEAWKITLGLQLDKLEKESNDTIKTINQIREDYGV